LCSRAGQNTGGSDVVPNRKIRNSVTTVPGSDQEPIVDESVKQKISDTIEQTEETAQEVADHPWTQKLARFGFYSKGFLFIVIGVLAILVAFGYQIGKLTDATGAFSAIALAPFGKVVLVIFIIGALGHGAWNILRGAADVDNAGGGALGIAKRILSISIGFFYFWLAWSAWSIVATARSSTENGAIQQTLTSILLALPFGAILVFLIGVSVIGAGVHECYRGWTGKFRENYKQYKLEHSRSDGIVTVLGVLSFTARALIFLLIGYFFITAAIQFDASEAVGIDGALLKLARSSYGRVLLFVTAVGLISHGILSLYEATYRRIC